VNDVNVVRADRFIASVLPLTDKLMYAMTSLLSRMEQKQRVGSYILLLLFVPLISVHLPAAAICEFSIFSEASK
jgi:hypothetical protein